MSQLLTPRDWQAQAQREASELLGTPEGAAKLVEAKRYGALADEIERLSACLSKANESTEHFERQWYLATDEIERLQAKPAPVLLTDGEIDALYWNKYKPHEWVLNVRAIEAAVLKKNGISQ